MSASVRILQHTAGTAAVEPAGYLGGHFNAYRNACQQAGARWTRADGTRIAIERIHLLVAELQRAGFHVDVEAALHEAHERHRREVADAQQGAAVRAQAVDAELARRGLSLYPYQRTGAGWLAGRRAAVLADDMGLGKTIQALIALPAGAGAVVVCPKLAKATWGGARGETARWRPEFRRTILDGRGSFRWPQPGEMVVTNYDILPDSPGACPERTFLVADEAHALKDPGSLRTKRFRALSAACRGAGGTVWLLTGTPLLNHRPPELWHILQAADLAPEAFGSWPRFKLLLGSTERIIHSRRGPIRITEWLGRVDPTVPELLRRVMLKRRRTEVLPELPAKTYRTVEVELTKDAARACEALAEDLAARYGTPIEEALEYMIEHRNSAPGFEEFARLRALLATAKIQAALELVEEYEAAEEPLVLFSRHRAPIDTLAGREGWGIITGDTSSEERAAIVERFQAGKLRGLAATIQAGGVAITLTRAAHVAFIDLDWTPALNAQAEDRVCRLGQTRGVVVTHLVAAHVLDAHVAKLLARKQALIGASVDAAAVPGASAPAEVPAIPEPAPGTLQEPKRSERRAAATDAERWAARALVHLAAMDPDRAQEENFVGFNALDGEIGHSLAGQVDRGLTDKQWKLAIRVCKKYHRQVGACPEAT